MSPGPVVVQPVASGRDLDAFVAFDKEADFVGKRAALEERAAGPKKKLVTLVVNTKDVDCVADEPIFHGGQCVGYVTSGCYGH